MSQVEKSLGQLAPSAATLTTIATVPTDKAWTCKLTACNRSATPSKIRMALRPAGAAISNEMYFCYDLLLGPNEVYTSDPLTPSETDKLDVYSEFATVSFSISGYEDDQA